MITLYSTEYKQAETTISYKKIDAECRRIPFRHSLFCVSRLVQFIPWMEVRIRLQAGLLRSALLVSEVSEEGTPSHGNQQMTSDSGMEPTSSDIRGRRGRGKPSGRPP